jgi:hypothetical protein
VEIILNHVNVNINVHGVAKGEARHRKYGRLKLGGGEAYDRSTLTAGLESLHKLRYNLLHRPVLTGLPCV